MSILLVLNLDTNSVGSVAPSAMYKVLQRIAMAEGLKCSDDELRKVADLAGGDLRHAINELQVPPAQCSVVASAY